MKCAKCNSPAENWKCAICGEDADQHDSGHTHGDPPSDRHCMPKCAGCGQAEVLCTCVSE
ncbi:hypothetical protein LCGC14_0101420 [marine sediment metagenome]|uniref:Uncharacterized protein n=1 Tax=marine sediment metagenome TaxID=412755 RepID=A0A0F9VRX8_9ZZZZ